MAIFKTRLLRVAGRVLDAAKPLLCDLFKQRINLFWRFGLCSKLFHNLVQCFILVGCPQTSPQLFGKVGSG